MISTEQYPDWNFLALTTLSCSEHARRFKKHAHSSLLALFTHYYYSLTSLFTETYLLSTILILQTFSESKTIYQSQLEDWGFAVLLRWHLPPFCLLLLASTRDLQCQLQLNCHPAPDPHVDSPIMLWTSPHNIHWLDNTSAIIQHAWVAPVIAADKPSLWSSFTDSHNRVRLLAVSSPHSGDWMHALPAASCMYVCTFVPRGSYHTKVIMNTLWTCIIGSRKHYSFEFSRELF